MTVRTPLVCVFLLAACGSSHRHQAAPPSTTAAGGEGGEATERAGAAPLLEAGRSGISAGNGGTSGTEPGAPGGSGGEPGDANELGVFGDLAHAFCAAARACCAAADEPAAGLDGCEAGFSAQVNAVALVAHGSVTVDAKALAACSAAYASAARSCVLTEVLAACHGVVLGTRAVGESCVEVAECDRKDGPRVCVRSDDPTASGTCAEPARGDLDTPCARSCEKAADCSSTSISEDESAPTALCYEKDGLFCDLDGTCQSIVDSGGACSWDEACGSAGYCAATCEPRGDAGNTCDSDFGCVSGLTCTDDVCSEAPLADGYVCLGHLPLPVDT